MNMESLSVGCDSSSLVATCQITEIERKKLKTDEKMTDGRHRYTEGMSDGDDRTSASASRNESGSATWTGRRNRRRKARND